MAKQHSSRFWDVKGDDTQPPPEEDCDATLNLDNPPWGWVHPSTNAKTKSFALHKNKTRFGRHPDCEYVFHENQFEDVALHKTISSHHFQITRETDSSKGPTSVFIMDKSSNGTFVNGDKLEKDKKTILLHNSEICVSTSTNNVFIFSLNDNEWLPKEYQAKYKMHQLIGTGSFGEVYLASSRITKKKVAIKKLKIMGTEGAFPQEEVKTLQTLHHHNIVMMEDCFESPKQRYLVQEYVSGGTLKQKVDNLGRIEERDAKLVFYQLAEALLYLHTKKIIHRDVKPSNVLIAPYRSGDLVKLSDFGISKQGVDNPSIVCGTILYKAPELVNRLRYTDKVDVWSYGVSLFFCLSGEHPFREGNTLGMSVPEQIVRGYYSMGSRRWRNINKKAWKLITLTLMVSPEDRPTSTQIIDHGWFEDMEMKERHSALLNEANVHFVLNDNLKKMK
ncbi:serine/threonine-protein kinase Chk2-like [Macrosteles quadrilineatus]|uniref:serine/threonine-protein kinase Chk2-like n=1 Tax=Macrosteles quadrilineatus TaxID=74068 RepID=UPI0023E16D8C|nr:serine/threonine-protein kinase Chk2-like [Macrosteles quadrilineatus]XP_054280586.1 serine/threonine-protein kinase Chk2-like [Macrosteles quadrilineatus]